MIIILAQFFPVLLDNKEPLKHIFKGSLCASLLSGKSLLLFFGKLQF